MIIFSSLPWNHGRPTFFLNSFIVGNKKGDENNSNSSSDSPGCPATRSPQDFSTDTLSDDFTKTSPLSSVSLAPALVSRLHSSHLIIAALAKIHQKGSFPVPYYESVEGCAAGVLVLATRAQLAPEELTAEAVLTFLWILKSFHSQYGSEISTVVYRFTELLDLAEQIKAALQKDMVALQGPFLARTDWKIRLDNTQEIYHALKELRATRGFNASCHHIEMEAVRLFEHKKNQQHHHPAPVKAAAPAVLLARNLPLPLAAPSVASGVFDSAQFPVIPSQVFPAASYVTPPRPAARRHFQDSPLPVPDSDGMYEVYEDSDSYLSDFEDMYSDFENFEEEEEYRLASDAGTAAAAAAAAAQARGAALLGKRQQKPWEDEEGYTREEPPRKRLLATLNNQKAQPRSSGKFLEAMSRPFFKAWQQRRRS